MSLALFDFRRCLGRDKNQSPIDPSDERSYTILPLKESSNALCCFPDARILRGLDIFVLVLLYKSFLRASLSKGIQRFQICLTFVGFALLAPRLLCTCSRTTLK